MAVPTGDLAFVQGGQTVRVRGEGEARGEGRIVFVSPVLDPETRSARAVVELPNPDGAGGRAALPPPSVATDEQRVDLLVPRDGAAGDRRARASSSCARRKASRSARWCSGAATRSARRGCLRPRSRRADTPPPTASSSRPSSGSPKPNTRTRGLRTMIEAHPRLLGRPALAGGAADGGAGRLRPLVAAVACRSTRCPTSPTTRCRSTRWRRRSRPCEVEKQVTFPVETALAGITGPAIHALAVAQRLLPGHRHLRRRRRHLLRPPAGAGAAGRGERVAARRAPSRAWGRSPPASAKSTCGRSSIGRRRRDGDRRRDGRPGWQTRRQLSDAGRRSASRTSWSALAYLRTLAGLGRSARSSKRAGRRRRRRASAAT